MNLVIPDDVLTAAKMSETDLKLEIAILLYQQRRISGGKARKLAELSVLEFQHELNRRGLTINYDVDEFEADLQTLQRLGDL